MHLIESYATHCGLRIDKPFVSEKFFPLCMDKYITFHPISKQSRLYDYWQEVISILSPSLSEKNIKILQLGGQGEHSYSGCSHLQGQTNIGQTAYIIRGAMLHLGCDSFPTHMASGLNKKIVSTYGVCSPGNTTPYWGNPDDHRLFHPDRKGESPCYSNEDDPKMINNLKPEDIASAVCDLLELELNYPYRTLYLGPTYSNRLVESVPDSLIDIKSLGIDNLIMRMDYLFDEDILSKQLQINPCSIITNKPIKKDILRNFNGNVNEVVYILDENHDPEFAKLVQELNVRMMLVSSLGEGEVNDIKIPYLDFDSVITEKRKFKLSEVSEEGNPLSVFKDKELNKLFYKSSKVTLSKEKIYLSKVDWEDGNNVESTDSIRPVTDTEEFWYDLEYMTILEKI